MGDSRKGQADEGGPEKLLERLAREAPEDRPEQVHDLRRILEMIKAGGPNNCASSLLFGNLAATYPSQYAALKKSWADNGGTLYEGFDHVLTTTAEEARSLNIREDVVFCLDGEDYGQEGYVLFTHEADALLMALGSRLREGSIQLSDALEAWKPYRKWCKQLYDPPSSEDEKLMIMAAGGVFESMPDAFEFFVEAEQYAPATARFELYAEDLGLQDVGWDWNMGNPIFSVESTEGLAALTKEATGRYRIVSRRDMEDYAKRAIRERRRTASRPGGAGRGQRVGGGCTDTPLVARPGLERAGRDAGGAPRRRRPGQWKRPCRTHTPTARKSAAVRGARSCRLSRSSATTRRLDRLHDKPGPAGAL